MAQFSFKMKSKFILFLFLSMTIIILGVNIVALLNNLYGTRIGRYISVFNLVAISIQGSIYLLVNKPFKKR